MDKEPTEILRVFLNSVIERLDVWQLKKAQDPLFQLSAPLSRNDLHRGCLDANCLGNHRVKRTVNVVSPVEDVVQVKREL